MFFFHLSYCKYEINIYLCNRNRERWPRKRETKNGALVQLVRIHACHAWGHGFESRTHRNNISKPLKVNYFQGLFS